jgi:hypothetical protein
MARWMKTCKSPKTDSVKLLLSAKFDGLFDQHLPDALPLALRRYNEPSQVGPLAIVIDPIDGDRAYNFLSDTRYPEPVMCFIKAPQKLRKLYGHFGFKEKMEAPMFVVIRTMELSNSTNGTRNITGQSYIVHSH